MPDLITCACPERCEIHPVNRGRRFFLMGALALPVAAKLHVPEAAVPLPQKVYRVTYRGYFDGGQQWGVATITVGSGSWFLAT